LSFESQLELEALELESLMNILNSGYEVAHDLNKGKSLSLNDHLNKLHDAHLRQILKSKLDQPSKDLKCPLRINKGS